MKAVVRDDVISLESFVQAEFKYKYYLETLRDSGNYCFLDQFKKLINGGEYVAKCMEELSLIKTESLNNKFKYIYLTDTAMKYLFLRDSESDFSEIKKSSISVQKVNKYPSEKVLMSSAYKFDKIFNGDRSVIKDELLNGIREDYYKEQGYINYDEKIEALKAKNSKITEEYKVEINKFNYSLENIRLCFGNVDAEYIKNLSNDINNKDLEIKALREEHNKFQIKLGKKSEINDQILKLINEITQLEQKRDIAKNFNDRIMTERTRILKNKEILKSIQDEIEKLQQLKKDQETKLNEGFEVIKNKIINLYDRSKIIANISNGTLKFKIFDTGNLKTAYGYLKIINELKSVYPKIDNIEIYIHSYSKNRSESLETQLIQAKKEKENALKVMESYEANYKLDRAYRSSWRYEPPKHYLVSESTYYNTPEFNVLIDSSSHYMDNYKMGICKSDDYIKVKDKGVIEDIKKSLSIKK